LKFDSVRRAFSKLLENDELSARQLFLSAGVAVDVSEELAQEVKKVGVSTAVQERLKSLEPPSLDDLISKKERPPYVIVFFGVNGVGKTTAVAKVARLLSKKRYAPFLVPADTYRAGAIEQLSMHAKALGLPIANSRYGADPASIVFDASKRLRGVARSVLLIDTAGRTEVDKNLMDEMKKLVRVASPDLRLLVLDALTGNDVLRQVDGYGAAVGVDGFVVTKLDADKKGGIFLTLSRYRKPVFFVSFGQDYDSLEEFKAQDWVSAYS